MDYVEGFIVFYEDNSVELCSHKLVIIGLHWCDAHRLGVAHLTLVRRTSFPVKIKIYYFLILFFVVSFSVLFRTTKCLAMELMRKA